MKKGIHSKTADKTDGLLSTKCPGYLLNYPSLKSPIFVNENVWKDEEEKRKPNVAAKSKSSKIYSMLSYSMGPFHEKYGGICNGYEAGFYRPLTSPNQIKLTTKKKVSDEEVAELNNYLTDSFDIRSSDEFTQKHNPVNTRRDKGNMILLKAVEDSSTNDRDPPKGILKKDAFKRAPTACEKPKTPEVKSENGRPDGEEKKQQRKGHGTGKKRKSKVKEKIYPSVVSLSSHPKMNCNGPGFVQLPDVPLYTSKRRMKRMVSAPCLSFDVIRDELGANRTEFPLTCYLVAGTQAAKPKENCIIVMKTWNLHKTQKAEDEESEDEEEDEDEEDEEDEEKRPKMDYASIAHFGCINRIRSTIANDTILAASWSESGKVHIWDLKPQIQAVNDMKLLAKYRQDDLTTKSKPAFTFAGHQSEGFALDWCPTHTAMLATGDCKRNIHLWHPLESGWKVDQKPLIGHTDSVEDLQWSPNEKNVLCSASVDKTIRVWDARATGSKACMITVKDAHESDVNVIHWNRNEPFIVSGGDDGCIRVWDLRQLQSGKPVATFKHHTAPVTTVEWHPTEATVFASGGEDNQIALWDLAVEKDEESAEEDIENVPPQLLFIHQGQQDIKELHWHPHIPGLVISTALSGFNIFRTISV